jgi:hypothetical protein
MKKMMDSLSYSEGTDAITGVDKKRFVATEAGTGCKTHDHSWDYKQHYACLCDPQYRGPDCSKRECASTTLDPLGGLASAHGRPCSGRGICDYDVGRCKCFVGYFGEMCQTLDVQVREEILF